MPNNITSKCLFYIDTQYINNNTVLDFYKNTIINLIKNKTDNIKTINKKFLKHNVEFVKFINTVLVSDIDKLKSDINDNIISLYLYNYYKINSINKVYAKNIIKNTQFNFNKYDIEIKTKTILGFNIQYKKIEGIKYQKINFDKDGKFISRSSFAPEDINIYNIIECILINNRNILGLYALSLNKQYFLSNMLFNIIIIHPSGQIQSFGNINNMRLYIYTEDGIIMNPIININLI